MSDVKAGSTHDRQFADRADRRSVWGSSTGPLTGAPGHDLPFAKHLVTDRFMRFADVNGEADLSEFDTRRSSFIWQHSTQSVGHRLRIVASDLANSHGYCVVR